MKHHLARHNSTDNVKQLRKHPIGT